jgi:hypothetical protein
MTKQMQPINLVNQVASAISRLADPDNPGSLDNWKPEAYAAVRAVADWINDQNNSIPSWTYLQLQKELDQYDQNSIVPSPELVRKWQREANHNEPMFPQVAAMAAQWGADRQLEADAEWLDQNSLDAPHLTITPTGKSLVEAMRTKPPSLKEQALHELDKVDQLWATEEFGQETLNSLDTIRRALESIPDPS